MLKLAHQRAAPDRGRSLISTIAWLFFGGVPYSLCSALSGELTGTLTSASSTICKYLVRCEIVGVSSMWITVETVSEVDRRKVDTLARHSTSYWHIYNANNAANM